MEEGALFSAIPNKDFLHPDLIKYCCYLEKIQASFDHNRGKHVYTTSDGSERVCNGLLSYIHTTFMPNDYKQPKRMRSPDIKYTKKSSSREIGCQVSCNIEAYVRGDCVKFSSLFNSISKIEQRIFKFSTAIINWLNGKGYKLQVAELPVVFEKLGRMTRADLITKDRTGKHLVVWEIKCGWPSKANNHDKRLKTPLNTVSCATFNKWYIQAVYTNAGLKNKGLNSECVKILHCWEEEIEFSENIPRERNSKKSHIIYKVQAYDMPEWAKRLQTDISQRI